MSVAPSDLLVTGGLVREGAQAGTIVATLAAVDDDPGDSFTYAITGDPSGLFEIVDNAIVVKAGAALDYETAQSHQVTVQVTDSFGNVYSKDVTLQVQDLNEITGTSDDDQGATALQGTIGDDLIDGLAGNDEIHGDAGSDIIAGGEGNDLVYGSYGDDDIDGGADDDQLYGEQGSDTLRGGDGNDELRDVSNGISVGNLLDGGAGDDRLYVQNSGSGYTADNTLLGGDGDDSLFLYSNASGTGSGNNRLEGGDGDDILSASGYGDATLLGGAGNDELGSYVYGSDSDVIRTLDGGDGDDMLEAEGSTGTLTGGEGNDAIYAGSFDGSIDAGSGNDTITANTVSGSIDAGIGADRVTLNNSNAVAVALGSDTDQDVLKLNSLNVQATVMDFTAGTGGDKIDLTAILNSLAAYDGTNPFGSGFLRLHQDGSDTLLQVDANGGGDGYITLLRLQNTTATAFTAENFTPSWAPDGVSAPDGEIITGTPDDDRGATALQGTIGDDVIDGLAGDDEIRGNSGADTIVGGEGNDVVYGSYGDDEIDGGADDDTLYGEEGADTLHGGDGNDYLSDVSDGVSVGNLLDGGAGSDQIQLYNYGFGQTADNTLLGGDGDDSLYLSSSASGAGSGNNRLEGGDGNDYLQATGYGDATLLGGAGDDNLHSSSSDDGTGRTLDGGDGNDTLYVSSSTGTLTGGEGNDTIDTYYISGSIDAGAGADQIILNGYNGALTVALGSDSDQDVLKPNSLDVQATVADFTTGTGGDRIDLTQILNLLSGYDGTNPFGSGLLRLLQDGADTLFEVDANGGGDGFTTLLRLQNTDATAFTAENFSPAWPTDGSTPDGETITGTPGDDYGATALQGTVGDDVIDGLAGNDEIHGGSGSDTISGGDGYDTLYGEFGDDEIDGGADDDTLYGEEGADTLHGGDGNDYLSDVSDGVSVGNLLDGGAGSDQIQLYNYGFGQTADNTLLGGDGDDTLYLSSSASGAGSGNNRLEGGDGNDYLQATGYGDATLLGGAGDDNLYSSSSDDGTSRTLDGGDGNDTLYASFSTGTLTGGEGNDTIGTYYSSGSIDAGSENDTITASSFSGSIDAGAGADRVTLNNGSVVTIALGSDTDQDVLKLDSLDVQATIADFTTGSAGDRIDITDITGQLSGYDGTNPFVSRHLRLLQDGADTLLQVDADGDRDSYTTLFRLQNTTATAFTAENFFPAWAPAGGSTPDGETIIGTPGDDQGATALYGTIGDDLIDGLAGDDEIYGDAGSDTITGGDGDDTIYGEYGDDDIDGGAGSDMLFGDQGNDILRGGNDNDTLSGGTDDDTLYGDGGNDTISGGAGVDTLYGGDGNDYLSDGNAGERLYGEGGNDTLSGSGAGLYLDGGDGDDTISSPVLAEAYGGAGNDTISVSARQPGGATPVLNGGEGIDTLNLAWFGQTGNNLDFSLVTNFEYLTFNNSISTITLSDVNVSAGGLLTVIAEYYGPGVTIDGSAETDGRLSLTGTDLHYGYPGDDTLIGGSQDDELFGLGGDDQLDGGAGNDIINGGAGDDVIIAGAGDDTIDGGEDFDIAVFSGNLADYSIVQDGNILTVTGPDGTDTLINVNRLEFADQSIDIVIPGQTLVGDENPNTITGSEGNDIISGGDGNDTLSGRLGDDIIHGDDGDDQINGGANNDTLYGDGGNDTISGGTGVDTLYGGDGNDYLSDGNAGERLYGEGGNDTLSGSGAGLYLDGGDGDDTISSQVLAEAYGGAGNDTISVSARQPGGATPVLDGGEGIDTLNLAWFGQTGNNLDFSLVTNFEYLTFNNSISTITLSDVNVSAGGLLTVIAEYYGPGVTIDGSAETDGRLSLTGTDRLYGYPGDDTLIGGSQDDELFGLGGDDQLDGGAGNDSINGGTGDDITVYSGELADYTISYNNVTKTFAISDRRTDSPDGADTVRAVETFRFNGTDYAVVDLLNLLPQASPITLSSIVEDSGERIITAAELLAGVSDGDDPSLTIAELTIASGNGTLMDNGNGTWTYIPAENDDSAVIFTYTVSDGQYGTSSTASLDITPVNDVPEASPVDLGAIAEDGELIITAEKLLAGVSDADGSSLIVTDLSIASGNGTLVDNGDGTWTYTPAENDDTEVTFSYTVSDGEHTASSTAFLDITPVNDAPEVIAPAAPLVFAEDALIAITGFSVGDIDDDELTVTLTADGALTLSSTDGLTFLDGTGNGEAVLTFRGSVAAINAVLDGMTYAPGADQSGQGAITYSVSNGEASVDGALNIDIAPVADAPTLEVGDFTPQPFTDEIAVANGREASVAALTGGGFVVTWTSWNQDGSDYGVFAQRYDGTGAKIGDEFRVNTHTDHHQMYSSVAALSDGGFVVTWSSLLQDGDGYGVYAQRYDAAGQPVDVEFRVTSYTTNNQMFSSVAALADGGFMVTWASAWQGGQFFDVYAQRYDSDGAKIGDEFRVNTHTDSDQKYSSAAVFSDGSFVVTWSSYEQDGSGWSIYTQRYDSNGTKIGAETRANTHTTNDQWVSSVAALSDDGFVVTWTSDGQDGAGYGVYAQRYDADGQPVGGEFRVATTGVYPSIVALPDGGFVITWSSGDGSGPGIYAQRFDGEGQPVGDEFRLNQSTYGNQLHETYYHGEPIAVLADGKLIATWFGDQVSARLFTLPGSEDISGTGLEDQPLTLPAITAALTDTDGSETLTLRLSGFPEGATFSVGARDDETGEWVIADASDIASLATTPLVMTPPANWNGSFTLTMTVQATDTATLSSGPATHTASVSRTIPITITAANDAPEASPVDLGAIAEDGELIITAEELLAGVSDVDGPSLTISDLSIGSGNGTLVDNGDGTWTYTPAENDDTGVTFNYTVSDGQYGTSSTASLDITPVNDVPEASPVDLGAIAEDGELIITAEELLAGVSDVDGPSLTISDLSIGSGDGTLVDNGDGTWTYTPAENDDTEVTFDYTVSDGEYEASSTASLDITPVNDAPEASPVDLGAIAEDGDELIITAEELLTGVSDVDGPSLTITDLSIASGNGTLVDNGDGTWSYTPAENDDTEVTFNYTVSDGENLASSTATLDIIPSNEAPEASPVDLGTIDEDSDALIITEAELLVGVSDPDGPSLTITDLSIASGNGTLEDNGDGTWTYTSAEDDDSEVTFDYTVSDGEYEVSSTALLDITPVNDEPQASPVDLGAVAEDGELIITAEELLAGVSDVDGPSLTITLSIASGNGTLVDNGDGTWTYTPAEDDDGEVTFNYTVSDGEYEVSSTASLDITPVNDAPEASPVNLGSIDEDGTRIITVAELLAGASDIDGPLLTISDLTIADGGGTLEDNGDGTWTFTPDDDGTVTFDYTVSDGEYEASSTATLGIIPVNEAPEASPVDLGSIAEDGGARIISADELLVGVSDADGSSLIITDLTIADGSGTLVNNGDGTWTYTPDENDDGEVTFDYTVSDGEYEASSTASLDITPVNDEPEASPVDLGSLAEDSDELIITAEELLTGVSDVDGPSLTITDLQIASGNGTLVDNGDSTWTYLPVENDDTEVTFNYTVSDGESTVSSTASLDITPVNDAPEASPVDLGSIAEDSGERIITAAELLAGASDVDGPSLTIIDLTIADGSGTLVDNGDGSWTYTPDENDDGEVTFDYTVSDGEYEASSTASLDITPVNDAPEASPVDLGSIVQNGGERTITAEELLAGVSDLDGSTLTISHLQIVSGEGSLLDNFDGTWTYTPSLNDDTEVTFSYTVWDGDNAVSSTAFLDITPAEIHQEVELEQGSTRFKLGLVSVPAPDGDPVTYTVSVLPALGTVFNGNTALTVGTVLTDADLEALTYTASDTSNADQTLEFAVSNGAWINTLKIDIAVNPAESKTYTGTAGSDELDGAAGNDIVQGLGGNDFLIGGAGNDTLDGGTGADEMYGGKGNDTYVVDNAGDRLIETNNDGTDTVRSSVTYTLSDHVENLVLTGSANINGTGNGLNNNLTGNSGNNTLDGKAGADAMAGALGDDTYVVDDAGDKITEKSGEGTDTVRSSVSFTLPNHVEHLILTGSGNINGTGNGLGNNLTGNSGNNTLDGKAGADVMAGGLGDDTYVVDNAGDTVTEKTGAGTDIVRSSVSFTLSNHVEHLILIGSANINGTGNGQGNNLTGNSGRNTLDGKAGADVMAAGLGDDTYVVDNAGDTVTEKSGEGTDTVRSSVTHTLSNHVENLVLTGSGNINGTGNGLNNNLTGNSGKNTLDGKAGADVMAGGLGDDTYVVDNAGDKVTEKSGEGTDTARSSVTYTLSNHVENLVLTGSGNINGTGNGLSNNLTGNSGKNTLDGKAGADVMAGGLGDDTYVVDNAGDTVTEKSGGGTDTVRSSVSFTLSNHVDNLVLTGSANINGMGNALNNSLTGNSSNNTLDGGAGNDTIIGGGGRDTLVGGSGNDTLTGGAGKDVFVFDAALSASNNVDTITDFSVADDTIWLDNTIFKALTSEGTLAAGRFVTGTKALDANDNIIYNNTSGALLYDADGNGAGAAVKIATLSTGLALTNADFVIV